MTAYTHGHEAAVLRSHRWRTAENSAAFLLPHLRPGSRLLDVGCGPGTITIDLAERIAPGQVVGIDQATDVLEQARAFAAALGVSTVEFVSGDVLALDAPDGSFDVVFAHQVLQHLGDPVAALREMRRVCRPGGIVAARDSDYAGFLAYPTDPVLEEWLALYRAVMARNGAQPDAGRRLLSWARRAGFSDVTPSASVWCFATPAERDYWGGMWAERVLASTFTSMAMQTGLSTRDDLERMSRAWQEWAGSGDGWYLVPHGEIICRA